MNWLTTHALGWLIGAIPIGTITFALAQYIKKASDWIDQANATTKRVVLIPAVALAVTALGAALHVPIVCQPDTNCLTALNGSTLNALVQALLGVVVAFITHAGKGGNTSTAAPTP